MTGSDAHALAQAASDSLYASLSSKSNVSICRNRSYGIYEFVKGFCK